MTIKSKNPNVNAQGCSILEFMGEAGCNIKQFLILIDSTSGEAMRRVAIKKRTLILKLNL